MYFFLILLLSIFSQAAYLIKEEQISEIDNLIGAYPSLHIGYEIYSLKKKEIILASNQHHVFTPGSTTKLFTVIHALDFLGDNYAFKTSLITDGKIKKKILSGNIFIKASGDPSLTTENIYSLFEKLIRKNIQHIEGDIYIDNAEFDEECYQPGCCINNLGYVWNNPIRGFIVDRQVVGIQEISTICFIKKNEKIENLFVDAESIILPALQKAHITFSGRIAFNSSPQKGIVLANHYSVPLKELVIQTVKESDNLYSDCLFKKIGALKYGAPGTWLKGARAINEFLEKELHIKRDEVLIFDGSGRSRYNLFSPHHLIQLLAFARTKDYFPLLMDSFPIAAIDGTLKERMATIPNTIKAKTGTVYGVTSLAGYAQTENDLLEFALMINGDIPGTAKTDIEDIFCKILVKDE